MPTPAGKRLVILAGVAAYVAVALGSGLDRLAVQYPALVRYVPHPLAAAALRARAAEILHGRNGREAIAAARAAVMADPADHRSAALLGAAYLAAGMQVPADRAFRTAARFGWRDPLTQLYLMEQALAVGATELAALRLDAVLRQNPHLPLRDMVLAKFEATDHGRTALAHRLALRPAWANQFMGHGGPLPAAVLRGRADVLRVVPGQVFGCEAAAPLINQQVRADTVRPARDLWDRYCQAGSASIADPEFRSLARRQRTAFDWNLASGGDFSAAPAPSPQTGLLARVSGASSRMIAWQMLTLQPGQYRLRWTALDPAHTPAGAVSLSLSCRLGDRIPLIARSEERPGVFTADLELDGTCAGQYLTIWLAPTAQEVRIGGMAIQSTTKSDDIAKALK